MFVYPRNTNKGGWSYFHFDAVEVSGVSELNTLVLQNTIAYLMLGFLKAFSCHIVQNYKVWYIKNSSN